MVRLQYLLGEIVAAVARGAAGRDISGELRRDARHVLCEPVEIQTSFGCWPAELLDVSRRGVRIRVVEGFWPGMLEEVTIRCCDSRYLHGRIAWSRQGQAGIMLVHEVDPARDFMWIEGRGRDWLLRTARARGRR